MCELTRFRSAQPRALARPTVTLMYIDVLVQVPGPASAGSAPVCLCVGSGFSRTSPPEGGPCVSVLVRVRPAGSHAEGR